MLFDLYRWLFDDIRYGDPFLKFAAFLLMLWVTALLIIGVVSGWYLLTLTPLI